MDLKKAGEFCKKYLQKENALRLVVILGICGIGLLALSSWDIGGGKEAQPEPQQEETAYSTEYAQGLEKNLARVVGAITGERDPVVLVTLEDTGRRVYAADRQENTQTGQEGEGSTSWESAHVLLEDREGAQRPLAISEQQPKIQGVVIVSRYAADPVVREKLVAAAKTALGVPSSRVCVAAGQIPD